MKQRNKKKFLICNDQYLSYRDETLLQDDQKPGKKKKKYLKRERRKRIRIQV